MTIYVTGSHGFIGSHFIEEAERQTRTDEVEIIPLDTALQGQDNASILRVLEHVGPEDLVVLLGAHPEVERFARNPGGDVVENLDPIVRQMHRAKDAGLIILASSFGGLFTPHMKQHQQHAVSTEAMPWPVSPYFAGKLAAEAYLHALHNVHGTPYRVARFANVYGGRGPNQLSEWRGVIPDWMQRRRQGLPYDVWGELESTRDYIHVSDVVEALWRLWAVSDRPQGDTLHLGTGVLTSLKDLGLAIATTEPQEQQTEEGEPALRVEPAFTFEDAHAGYTVAGSRVDVKETVQTLRHGGRWQDWEPIDLEEGLRRTWRSYLMEGRA